MSHIHTNHLINETSPYLLQHAHNPVDWFPWGEAALQKAKESDKPILVSIGYSACHWCHVMERESFEDETAAKMMNEHFINIKIDREERPDLDHIYMDAVQAMSGGGGWPLNVFLTPDAKPFYGGTYFPPVKAFNRSSWMDVLQSIAQAWKERKNEIESQAENLVAYLQKANGFGQTKTATLIPQEEDKTKEQCHHIFETIMKTADKEWGGFGNAPKFPQTFVIQYLLQYHHFSGNKEALQQALLSIDKMLQGGIYDHIAGGLARYSTDKDWLAPHFEKMLYDNALLISVLCDVYQITGNKAYEDAIRKTIRFVEQELMSPENGFYAALDADSEGEEGKYYVWQKVAIDTLLGKDSALFCNYFDVTDEGNWEEKNILRMLKPIDQFVNEQGIDKAIFEKMIQESLQKLSAERDKRIRPQLDDKIILSWNALMLSALCKAAATLRDDGFKIMAEKNFQFLQAAFRRNKGSFEMFHTFKNGIAKTPAFLDDHAYLIDAYIKLYEITFDSKYLDIANEHCNYVLENFSDDQSPFFFFTHQLQTDIIVRKKEIYDGATPSGNAIMANNLLKLSIIFDKPEWRQRSTNMLQELVALIEKYPSSFGIWSTLLLQLAVGINEIAVVGEDHKNVSEGLMTSFIPNKIIMSSNESENFPMLKGKYIASGTLIFLCKNYSCNEPYKTAQNLLKELFLINKI